MQKKLPVKNGEQYEITITGLGQSGEGVGRKDGFTVFIPGALPKEKVIASIKAVKKNYALGRLEKVLQKSPLRTNPSCPLFEKCGGCQLQHLSYEGQCQLKEQKVKDALEHIGGFKGIKPFPIIADAKKWRYRNKMMFPIGKNKNKKAIIGCFAASTHQIIDTKDCLIQQEYNNKIAAATRKLIDSFHLPVYDEDKKTGLLRHVVGRVNRQTKEIMLILVTAQKQLVGKNNIIKFLRQELPEVTSIYQNLNQMNNNVILGERNILLYGKEHITERLGTLNFLISPSSFFQVNTAQAEKLYQKALEYAGLKGDETVIDAYCGTGTMTMFLAQKAARAIGIEINHEAIIDAKKNARLNKIENAEFIDGDSAKIMPRLYREGLRPDVIVTDPPRSGCAQNVLKIFADMKPQKIVYISCDPASLARDCKYLDTLGYKIKLVQPVDMFPQTAHVETVVLLSNLNVKAHKC